MIEREWTRALSKPEAARAARRIFLGLLLVGLYYWLDPFELFDALRQGAGSDAFSHYVTKLRGNAIPFAVFGLANSLGFAGYTYWRAQMGPDYGARVIDNSDD